MKKLLLYIWQLPQHLVGYILRLFIRGEIKINLGGVSVYYKDTFTGGISLGDTILVGSLSSTTAKHEHGHQHQSQILGWFYLPIIGIPSIIWAALYDTKLFPRSKYNYYKFYTEKWADKLGGVKR